MRRLNKQNIKMVYKYIDLLRDDEVEIENIIQNIRNVKGLIVKADIERLRKTRNFLIKAQNQLHELRDNLHKSDEFKKQHILT